MYPNYLEGNMFYVHFSNSFAAIEYLGDITPHLFNLPINSITIFYDLWSSIISNSPIYPCFCMTFKNLIKTEDDGLTSTYFFPYLSQFIIFLKQSAKMLTFTIVCTLFQ